jgi:hypothetical protein
LTRNRPDHPQLFEVDLKSLSVLGSHQVDGPVLDVRLGSASDAVYVSSAVSRPHSTTVSDAFVF